MNHRYFCWKHYKCQLNYKTFEYMNRFLIQDHGVTDGGFFFFWEKQLIEVFTMVLISLHILDLIHAQMHLIALPSLYIIPYYALNQGISIILDSDIIWAHKLTSLVYL